MRIHLGLLLILCQSGWRTVAAQELRAVASCYVCDSANQGQENCGYDGLASAECSGGSAAGCYSQIYEKTDTATTGWYARRGCLDDTITCSAPTCTTCEEADCNKDLVPANRHQCHVCKGDNCDEVESQYCGVHLENNQDCVTVYDQNAKVLTKACYSDLPDATREYCDEDNLDCKKCTGVNCNTDTQREGTKCHECSGGTCLEVSGLANLVDCRSSCYIGLLDSGETVRGCSSNFDDRFLCSQDITSTKPCYTCEGDGCNSIIYPLTRRLQCHTCARGDCTPTGENLEYCEQYNADERCVSVFSSMSDTVLDRGCLSSLETQSKEICSANSANCLTCAYDKCNIDDSKTKTGFCIGCNSQDNLECLKENSNLEVRCSTNKCYSRLVEKEDAFFGQFIERGCLSDLTAVTTCVAPDCISCTGRNCNNKIFPERRISCKSCEGDSCLDGGVDKICEQYVSGEACFTFFDSYDKIALKGCYADAVTGTRDVCDDPTDLSCTKCSGNLCNVDTKRRGKKCYKCSGLECLKTGLADVVDCLSDCYVGVGSNGETVRDCAVAVSNSQACGITDTTCRVCNEDRCNAIVHPTQGRLTCFKCFGVECDTPSPLAEYCERWSPDERCVSVFDDSGALLERGCSSTVENTAICSANNPSCRKCNFDKCNVEKSTSETQRCVSCNSKDDLNCVAKPNSTSYIGCTSSLCFTRIVTGGHIERGCAASVSGCTGAGCQTCTGEICNSKIFPENRHSCNFCFGDQCAGGQAMEKICTIYEQDQQCITVYGSEAEVIYRDCYVDAVDGTKELCDDTSDLTCTKCTGKLCNKDTKRRGTKCLKCQGLECFNIIDTSNSIDCLSGGCYLGVTSDGQTKRDCASAVSGSATCPLGETTTGSCVRCNDDYCNAIAFPMRNRLICKECLGETCEEPVLQEKYCERLHTDESCVSVFGPANEIIERGCSSTVQNVATCNGTNSDCLKCNFNGCNVQTSKDQIHHCVSCNSKLDPDCVMKSANPTTKSCPTNACYTRIISTAGSPWQHTEKGCASEITGTCEGTTCQACQGDRCNNINYPTTRISCLSCRSRDECQAATIPTTTCQLYNPTAQACITLFNNDNEPFYRGCYSDAAVGTQQVCDDTSQLLCTKCKTNNCNNDTKRRGMKCFKCQGLQCFTPTYPADVVDCLSNCYMGVNEQGESVRGCASSFTNITACGAADNGVNRCSVCYEDLCNALQFPLNRRLECHTCNDEENCEAAEDNIEYCERYHGSERCVTVFSQENKVMERGCSSSLISSRYCDQNYQHCRQCPSRACNNITSKDQKLCVVCDASVDPRCITDPSSTAVKYCESTCYTRLVNGVLTRGCMEDLEQGAVCSETNNCQLCRDVDKCNVKNYPGDRRSCRNCNSIESCKNPQPQLCLRYVQGDSCVTVFNGFDVVTKGCLADQTPTNQVTCASDSNPLCIRCSTGDDCNIENVRRDENCISCNSALDPSCAQQPKNLLAEHCSVPSDGQCFSRVQNGATVRGCKGLLSGPDETICRNTTLGSTCTITTGPGSNNKLVPANRLKCFHCDSRVDTGCAETQTNKTHALPCKRFSLPENCLKLTYDDGAVVRGCVADFSADICQQGSCQTCKVGEISDGCNFSHGSIININNFCLLLTLIVFLLSISPKS